MYSHVPWTVSEIHTLIHLSSNSTIFPSLCVHTADSHKGSRRFQPRHNRRSCALFSPALQGPYGATGPQRRVRHLCTEVVSVKWEFGLNPVIPTQTDARRINYNTSENLNIMVRFNFLSSFSESISLL